MTIADISIIVLSDLTKRLGDFGIRMLHAFDTSYKILA
jgi:hypothetical protein